MSDVHVDLQVNAIPDPAPHLDLDISVYGFPENENQLVAQAYQLVHELLEKFPIARVIGALHMAKEFLHL